jgi:hypothetical protein
MKAWASEQGISFLGREDEGNEPKASYPPSSEGCHVAAPHWGSARRCPNVIDYITPVTMYSIGGIGGQGHLRHCNKTIDLPL